MRKCYNNKFLEKYFLDANLYLQLPSWPSSQTFISFPKLIAKDML